MAVRDGLDQTSDAGNPPPMGLRGTILLFGLGGLLLGLVVHELVPAGPGRNRRRARPLMVCARGLGLPLAPDHCRRIAATRRTRDGARRAVERSPSPSADGQRRLALDIGRADYDRAVEPWLDGSPPGSPRPGPLDVLRADGTSQPRTILDFGGLAAVLRPEHLGGGVCVAGCSNASPGGRVRASRVVSERGRAPPAPSAHRGFSPAPTLADCIHFALCGFNAGETLGPA